jgi:hypothetical protein
MLTVICRQNILRTITIKEVLILVTNILDSLESVRIFFVSFKISMTTSRMLPGYTSNSNNGRKVHVKSTSECIVVGSLPPNEELFSYIVARTSCIQ